MGKLKLFLFAFILLFSLKSFSQTKLDSFYSVWNDESKHDTIRLEALGKFIWNGFLYTKPDSAFTLAQTQFDFAKKIENKDWQATALNTQGATFYVQGEYSEALKYYKSSLKIQKDIGDKQGTAACLGNIAVIHELQGDYGSAIDYNTECLKLMEELDNKGGVANVLNNMGIIYDLQEDFGKARTMYEKALDIQEELGSKQGVSGALNNLGGIFAKLGSHTKAITHYQKSVAIQNKIGNDKGVANAYSNIGTSYKALGDYDSALHYYTKSIVIEQQLNNKKGLANTYNLMGQLHYELHHNKLAIEYSEKALLLSKEIGSIVHTRDASKVLFKCYKAAGNAKKALKMHELHIQMKDSVLSEENQRDLIHQEYQYTYEKNSLADSLEYAKKEAIRDLKEQKQEAEIGRQKIALLASLGGAVLLILLVLAVLRGKNRSDKLLLNILPEETAKELKQKGHADAKLIDQVTVLFTDFKDFTSISEHMAPRDLVESINQCFSHFDGLMEKHGVEKIKTIGDSYMAAGGLPTVNKTHITDVVDAALDIMDFMEAYSLKQKESNDTPFEIRIGIHSGPVVAGIVGVKKFQYDIWGDTVNTASRMESSGEVGKINVSKPIYDALKDNSKYSFEPRGKIIIKGKEKQEMFYLSLA